MARPALDLQRDKGRAQANGTRRRLHTVEESESVLEASQIGGFYALPAHHRLRKWRRDSQNYLRESTGQGRGEAVEEKLWKKITTEPIEHLNKLLETYGEEYVASAMSITAGSEYPSLEHLEGILEAWQGAADTPSIRLSNVELMNREENLANIEAYLT